MRKKFKWSGSDLPVAGRTARRSPWVPIGISLAAAGFIAAGAALLVTVPGPLSLWWIGPLEHLLEDPDATAQEMLGTVAQTILIGLGGIIAVIGVSLSIDRHRLELYREATRAAEYQENRDAETQRDLRSRFTTSVTLISDDDKPDARQAGMYALASLADDWQAVGNLRERDVCIGVICGYLRSAWDPRDKSTAEDERRVRSTGFNLIASHLRRGNGNRPWEGAKFNLQGSLIDFVVDATFVDVSSVVIDLDRAKFMGGTVDFDGASVSGGRVSFVRAEFLGSRISFVGAEFISGTIAFDQAFFSEGGVSFDEAMFSGGRVSFYEAMFSGGRVSFNGAMFPGGTVEFLGAGLNGTAFDYTGASFGGTLTHEGEVFEGFPDDTPEKVADDDDDVDGSDEEIDDSGASGRQ